MSTTETIPGYLDALLFEKSLYANHKSNADTKSLILVCQSDMRSIHMFKKMRENGNSNMKVLKGGIFAWKRAKLPVSQN